MRQIVTINPNGKINRRDLSDQIADEEVLNRVNFEVIGNGDLKRNRKLAGASRHSTSTIGGSYKWGTRYYSGQNRKTFAFNDNGKLYHVSDNGAESDITPTPFMGTAIPCSEVMRVSSNDVLYFSEGVSTGMYSHDGNIANSFTKEVAVTLNFVGLLSHLDRLFGFEENSEDLHFSKNLEPTNFTDSTDAGLITIGPRRGQKIMGIELLNETMYIFKQDSIWALRGRAPYEFDVREVIPYMGCAARRSIRRTDNGIIFMGSDFEFYFFDGTNLTLLTYKLAFGGDLTKNIIPLLNRDKLDSIVAEYHNKVYRCSFVPNGEVTNRMEWCFNTINETDWLTDGFNISCYIPWFRIPDKQELLFGRADLGRLMKNGIDWNVDNGATNPSMRFQLQTKFVGPEDARNCRFKRAYFFCGILGREPINCRYFVDTRTAYSDSANDDWQTWGEHKSPTTFLQIASQRSIPSRVNLKYGKSLGSNISFAIDHEGKDIDFELAKIDVEAVVKLSRKKSHKVAA